MFLSRNPLVHKAQKSGKIVHKNQIVDMWKITLIAGIIKFDCGKLLKMYFQIQKGCELFYNVARNQVNVYDQFHIRAGQNLATKFKIN